MVPTCFDLTSYSIPTAIDDAPRGIGVAPGVVVLVLLDVLAVAVVALEQQEAHELGAARAAAYVRQAGLQRVVVDERAVPEHLERREVVVDAAGDYHALVGDEGKQLLVSQVLALVQHVIQHVDIVQHRAEELRDGVVVGVPLVEVVPLREQQQRREGVGVAIQGADLHRWLFLIWQRHVGPPPVALVLFLYF
eukprot:841582-Prorocentrum_minimum.AAC.3